MEVAKNCRLTRSPPSAQRMSPMRVSPSPALLLSDGALVLANDARPRLAIGTECSAVVLGVKVRQEPSSVSLRPP
jgi:hypothetical protein